MWTDEDLRNHTLFNTQQYFTATFSLPSGGKIKGGGTDASQSEADPSSRRTFPSSEWPTYEGFVQTEGLEVILWPEALKLEGENLRSVPACKGLPPFQVREASLSAVLDSRPPGGSESPWPRELFSSQVIKTTAREIPFSMQCARQVMLE